MRSQRMACRTASSSGGTAGNVRNGQRDVFRRNPHSVKFMSYSTFYRKLLTILRIFVFYFFVLAFYIGMYIVTPKN